LSAPPTLDEFTSLISTLLSELRDDETLPNCQNVVSGVDPVAALKGSMNSLNNAALEGSSSMFDMASVIDLIGDIL